MNTATERPWSPLLKELIAVYPAGLLLEWIPESISTFRIGHLQRLANCE